jgi:hypothetical protein
MRPLARITHVAASAGGAALSGRWSTTIDGKTSASGKIRPHGPDSPTEPRYASKEPQRAGACAQPLVGHDETEQATRPEQLEAALEEVHIEIRHAVVRGVTLFQVWLEYPEELLPEIWRITDHDIEAARCRHLRERARPVQSSRINSWIGDDRVADPDAVIEGGEWSARLRS